MPPGERSTCVRCVMDTSDPQIKFDDRGVCNHCHGYQARMAQLESLRHAEPLERLIDRIKVAGRKRQYDCLIGVSGGVDSSYLAVLTRTWGLRALAVHLDNGWNSELAVENITGILSSLDIDLITHVVDWDEFRDVQCSFFEASVVDIELPTDNAIVALMYRTAKEFKIPFVLRGNNDTTEAIMPKAWNHRKTDARNVRSIHKRFGSTPIRTLPLISTLEVLMLERLRGTTPINVLDRMDYNRGEAMAQLEARGWRPYPRKHGESVFTRFYQSQVLPDKFGIDKRRAHLSTLINAGEMSRSEALDDLATPIVDPKVAQEDRSYALKKLGVDAEKFETWMSRAPVPHEAYPSEKLWMDPMLQVWQRLRRR